MRINSKNAASTYWPGSNPQYDPATWTTWSRRSISGFGRSTFNGAQVDVRGWVDEAIQTWYSRYRKEGVEALRSRPRSDTGVPRKVEPEALLAAIEAVRPRFRRWPPASTFRRLVRQLELLEPDTEERPKRRQAFCKAHINQLWQADTMVGPHVAVAGPGSPKRPTRRIAFLDDTPALIGAFRTAVHKRGVPEAVYVDNGSNYTSAEFSQLCVRLGVLLCHTPVADGAAKGKIERFFRTVREDFLSRALDLSSLKALNRQFAEWVENGYNHRPHATLGMRPIDRFSLERERVNHLAPNQGNDETFYYETTRTVDRANTFRFHGVR